MQGHLFIFHDLGAGGAGADAILSPVHYSWNNPVAIVTIRRVYRAHWRAGRGTSRSPGACETSER